MATEYIQRKSLTINGVTYSLPPRPPLSQIDGYGLARTEQYFRRVQLPDELYLSINNLKPEHQKIIEREYLRCTRDGYWFFCYGKPTYITPLHYFYLNYYTLENGIKPDYRDVDRRWFYFMDYCLSRGYIKGIIRLKKRREGATSQTCCWLLWRAIFFPNSRCGIVSKSEIDARQAYTDMVLNAWNELIPIFKPEHEQYTKKNIILRSAKKKKDDGEDYIIKAGYSGLNSTISYRPTTLNSYDSGRLSALLIDEAAKWENVSIMEYLPKVMKTLMEGAKRVGFCMVVSSMNQLSIGGEDFRRLYLSSDHTQSRDGRTQSGLYKYFVPAYDGLPGFIGKYGESIIDPPTRSQLKWLMDNMSSDMDLREDDIKLGSKGYLMKIRESIKDPVLLVEEKRSNPFSEEEVLVSGEEGIYFNATYLSQQMKNITENPPDIRIGRLYEDHEGKIRFKDDPAGDWHFLEFPSAESQNLFRVKGSAIYPVNHANYKIGVDPFRNNFITQHGSNGAILVLKTVDLYDPNKGSYPVAYYLGRKKMKYMFYDEVMKCCKLFSARALIESDIDDFYEYFMNKKMMGFLSNTPSTIIDPTLDPDKRQEKMLRKGVKSSDPFALSKQLELAQLHFENNWDKIMFPELLEQMYRYDHTKRTKSDLVIAYMMAVCDMSAPQPVNQKNELVLPINIQTYNLYNKIRV